MPTRAKTKLIILARKLSTSLRTFNNHYDVLGITPKASQSDIKSAYYKLSKLYHPDKSTDDASAKKFRAITEAYEVLGNVKLKNMYDKGILLNRKDHPGMTPDEEVEPTDPSLRFYKSRSNRRIVPTMDGRTPIYNFDAWAKNHYSSLYEKKRYEKEFVKQRHAKQAEALVAHRQETLMFVVFLLGGLFIILAMQGMPNYDKDLTAKKQPAVETQIIEK